MDLVKFNEDDVVNLVKCYFPIALISETCTKKCLEFFISATKTIKNRAFSEKIALYEEIWLTTIKSFYITYLPDIRNCIYVKESITPYTFTIANESAIDFVTMFHLTNADVEYLNQIYSHKILPYEITKSLTNEIEIANLIACMLIYPPIVALNTFYRTAYEKYSINIKKLYSSFMNSDLELPDYKTNLGLFFGSHFFDSSTYHSIGGIDALIESDNLTDIRPRLEQIKIDAKDNINMDINAICPQCGSRHGTDKLVGK